jgi:hypothetical protein
MKILRVTACCVRIRSSNPSKLASYATSMQNRRALRDSALISIKSERPVACICFTSGHFRQRKGAHLKGEWRKHGGYVSLLR